MIPSAGQPSRYAAEESRERDHGNEFGQCQDLVENAVAAQHERRAERDEVAGDMGDEKAAQAEEPYGIDETAVEREQGSNWEAAARFGHAKLLCGGIIPGSRLWP
jgi:hypothetical protein